MDLENKPNMKRTRIGGGYMVVGYGSGGRLWQRWYVMAAVVVCGGGGGIRQQWWYGSGDEYGAAAT